MNWTKTPPTRAGVYLFQPKYGKPEAVLLYQNEHDHRLYQEGQNHSADSWDGQWSGPLVSVEGLESYEHMTLRTYAAIKLRVPESGIDWLDDMIRKAQRDELAGQALAGICSQSPLPDTETEAAKIAYLAADAMLAQGKAN